MFAGVGDTENAGSISSMGQLHTHMLENTESEIYRRLVRLLGSQALSVPMTDVGVGWGEDDTIVTECVQVHLSSHSAVTGPVCHAV